MENIKEKSWDEFRKTGLLLIINQLLHLFGWAIVVKVEKEKVVGAFPARVVYRGFDTKSVSDAYIKATKFLKDNIEDLEKEANS